MASVQRAGGWRHYVRLVVFVYAACLATVQFEHHDLACHLKTPQHCTSCASSADGADPQPAARQGTAPLADAGVAVAVLVHVEGALLPVQSPGRSPPRSA